MENSGQPRQKLQTPSRGKKTPAPDPITWSSAIDRRTFLLRVGLIGLVGGLVPAFLQACAQTQTAAQPTPTPMGTPPQGSPPAPAPTPTVVPTATPTPIPTQTPMRSSTMSLRIKLAHLLRRAGFGANKEELDQYEKLGLEGTVRHLLNYDSVEDDIETRLSSITLDLTKTNDLQRWWLLRMIYSKRPLLEKMTFFWHGLLTSGISKVGGAEPMYDQNQLLRRHALGNYDTLLKEISRNPAMMIWLDSQVNKKKAPNENYARELMELFTTGIGHYTETDVRESARAFTGWSTRGTKGKEFFFNPSEHDNGIKTFLGKTGNFDGNDIVDILAGQRATAEFISNKLFSFFAYDNPEAEIVSKLADTYLASKYSIKAVMERLLTSDAFYSKKAYRAKIKSPVELVASTVRSLGLQTDARELTAVASRMGQTLFDPPNVAGWRGGTGWINSSTLLERINFVNRITNLAPNLSGPKEEMTALNSFVEFFLDGDLNQEERDVLSSFTREAFQFIGTSPSARQTINRSLLYLVLASPDYQLG